VLKLDNVPNTVPSNDPTKNDLGGAPNAADGSTRSEGRQGDHDPHFVTWPAHVGERFVPVRVSTEELARVSGETFSINSEKITCALIKHRVLIEQRANAKMAEQPDAPEVTLDCGSLTAG